MNVSHPLSSESATDRRVLHTGVMWVSVSHHLGIWNEQVVKATAPNAMEQVVKASVKGKWILVKYAPILISHNLFIHWF